MSDFYTGQAKFLEKNFQVDDLAAYGFADSNLLKNTFFFEIKLLNNKKYKRIFHKEIH